MTMTKREFTIDLKGLRLATRLHAKLAEILPVPDGYGRNFDALYDFLTEHGANLKVVFKNAAHVSPILRQVCSDAVNETPGLEITFEDHSGEII